MKNELNITTFLDAVGRTVLGEVIEAESNEKVLAVKNPAVVAVSQQQTGGLQLQILPLFFKEFLADKNEATIWYFNKNTITQSKVVLFDFKLTAQYQQLFGPAPQPSTPNVDVVKLFDE
jgi:hypothetical protein